MTPTAHVGLSPLARPSRGYGASLWGLQCVGGTFAGRRHIFPLQGPKMAFFWASCRLQRWSDKGSVTTAIRPIPEVSNIFLFFLQ